VSGDQIVAIIAVLMVLVLAVRNLMSQRVDQARAIKYLAIWGAIVIVVALLVWALG
jgi:hypothetical protein